MKKEPTNRKGLILRYVIAFSACLIVSFVIAVIMGLFVPWDVLKSNGRTWNFSDEYSKNLFILTNAPFIVGAILFCFGILVALANGGAFEFIVYGVRRFFSLFKKDPNNIKFKTFYDYHIYHSEKPKSPFLYLVIVGLIYVGISMIFMVLYINAMHIEFN